MNRILSVGIVPSFFTMANMFCGFYSVILATSQKFSQAAWLIVAAAVLDSLDGKLARMTKSSSEFGVQYDSLADVISFGLAPTVLLYTSTLFRWGSIGLFFSFLPLVFGSIRLARFNVRLEGTDKNYFEGLPIPAAAMALATFVIFNFYFWERLRWTKVFFVISITVSILMVTNFRYEVMPNFSLGGGRKNAIRMLLVLLCVVAIIAYPHETFFPLVILYVVSGPAVVIWKMIQSDNKSDTENMGDEQW